MPAGFQSFTNDGVTQLTNDGIFFSLVNKGILTGSESWGQEGQNSAQHEMTISGVSKIDQPLLALHSTTRNTWSTLTADSANSVTFTVYATGSGIIEWFLFSLKDPQANPSRSGLELRRDDGTLCFASDFPPVLPMGVIDNNGYSGIPISDRKLAHISLTESYLRYRNVTYGGLGSCLQGGMQGYRETVQEGWGRSTVFAGMGEVGGSKSGRHRVTTYPGACNLSRPPQNNSLDQSVFKSLIVDVTNY